jgi:16S rRNA (cytosine1402-N4)-methyltransferase
MPTLSNMNSPAHTAVLAPELVQLLHPGSGDTALDCTFGAGGHARLVAERIGNDGSLVCVDRDPDAERRFEEMRDELGPGARFVRADFADAIDELAEAGESVDVAYMDLGVSSPQLDVAERGFSYAADAPLDMRMDPDQALSAGDVVNEWPTDRLAGILRQYGEERHARSIAAEIARRRPIESTFELVEAIRNAVPPSYRFGRGHPAKKTFQAIRIAVNGELDSLDRALPGAWALLEEGGRLGTICFHSLEDRKVKRFLADRARECVCPPELPQCVCTRQPEAELLTRRAIAASPEEAERNPRSRSARLRVARKLRGPRDDIPYEEAH